MNNPSTTANHRECGHGIKENPIIGVETKAVLKSTEDGGIGTISIAIATYRHCAKARPAWLPVGRLIVLVM
jgi:hypothetical protein